MESLFFFHSLHVVSSKGCIDWENFTAYLPIIKALKIIISVRKPRYA